MKRNVFILCGLLIIAILCVAIHWYCIHFYKTYKNFRIENVYLQEVTFDSLKDSNMYMLTFQCKKCNEIKRWGAFQFPLYEGIDEKINKLAIKDSLNNDISLIFTPISKYNETPLGKLYLSNLRTCVRSAVSLDSITKYLNSATFDMADNVYNPKDSSYYFSMLYRLDGNTIPQSIYIYKKGTVMRFKRSTRLLHANISCIIPLGQEKSKEAIAIRNHDYK